MTIKILGGLARGFPLAVPKSLETRPTSVLIKRKLFDWRQNLEGHIFVDLCAGSGAVGLEALSRGAEKIYLNDSQKSAFITIKQNQENFLKAFRLEKERIVSTQLEAKNWIGRELKRELPSTENVILFFDPPYEEHALYEEVLRLLADLSFQGEIWLEADRLKGPALTAITGLFRSIIKTVEQGDHFVVVGKVL